MNDFIKNDIPAGKIKSLEEVFQDKNAQHLTLKEKDAFNEDLFEFGLPFLI